MEKLKYLTVAVQEQPEEHGGAQAIADMFATMEEVSFARDIAPVLFEKFAFQVLDMNLCAAAQQEMERAIDIARRAGHIVKCVPKFEPNIYGTMEVIDIIYKRVGWM